MNTAVVVVLIIAAVVGVVALTVVLRGSGSRDGVDSFRRQIDALSPEARRPVVDQVQNAAGRQTHDDEDEDDDEDGTRGA